MRHTQQWKFSEQASVGAMFLEIVAQIILQKAPLRRHMSYMPTTQKLLPQLFKISANPDQQCIG